MKAAVIGLGYVGLPLACLLSRKGFEVYGIDVSKEKVDLINDGISPIDDEKLKKEILDKLARVTDKNLEITEIVDQELIGGFKLNFEDYQYNNSVKKQLQRLAKVFSDNLYVSKI